MVSFTGRCLTHRAEIMQLRGAWGEALEEARRAGERFAQQATTGSPPARPPTGRERSTACSDEFGDGRGGLSGGQPARVGAAARPRAAAPGAGQGRGRRGRDPPRGRRRRRSAPSGSACCPPTWRSCSRSAIPRRRAAPAASSRSSPRGKENGHAARRSSRSAGGGGSGRGRCPGGARRVAPGAARRGRSSRHPTRPRARGALLGLACRALGDEEGAALELEAAREAFAELGAAPDVARVDALRRAPRRWAKATG